MILRGYKTRGTELRMQRDVIQYVRSLKILRDDQVDAEMVYQGHSNSQAKIVLTAICK